MKNSNTKKQNSNTLNMMLNILFFSVFFLTFNYQGHSQYTPIDADDMSEVERGDKKEKTKCDCWYKYDQPFDGQSNLSEMARQNPVRTQITQGCDQDDCGGSCNATVLGRTVRGTCHETTAASSNRLGDPNGNQGSRSISNEMSLKEFMKLLDDYLEKQKTQANSNG